MNKDKKTEMKDFFPVFLMGGLFVLIHGLALFVTRPFEAADMVVFDNPNDPMNIVYFFLTLVLFTVAILLIAKFWKKQLIQGIILGATGYFAFFMFYPLLAIVVPEVWSLFLSITAAAILLIALVKYPEWYVIDVCGIIVGVGAIATFGISLSIFLVIVLLIGLAIYDAISVYKTKHMIDLADTVLDLKLPIILVIPKIREYSLIKETKSLKEKLRDDEERHAFFMGLGDIIIPGFLVASTFHNIAGNGLLIALSVMLGTLFGFIALMRTVIKGKPQAGLPYLCSGAILGYLISSYLLSGELVGLTFPI
ncbi:MAG: presenilin family intramembrane aspartyl protease [Candidatus Bathyarchaeota archaeon]|nr:presenilin family intramembrane aspartyl protease [Candidatus Bathyarchaeota archaeon]MDH5532238.1 presenilin family intramembrane aspartyl protease [Candidatus Bathyarchaeota archaeon]MDH5712671.1 presenilin family intramembrane aspartyl protease [Candidatus Bathyarchaeota archaeon]